MDVHRMSHPSEPIVYIDHSDIREDAIEELRAGVRRLVEFIDAREPQLSRTASTSTKTRRR